MTAQGTLHSPRLPTCAHSPAGKCLEAEREHFQLLTLHLHYSKCLWDSIYDFQYAALYTLLRDVKALLYLFPYLFFPLAVSLTGFAVRAFNEVILLYL